MVYKKCIVRVFLPASQGEDDLVQLPWSARMAVQLLEMRHNCATCAPAAHRTCVKPCHGFSLHSHIPRVPPWQDVSQPSARLKC